MKHDLVKLRVRPSRDGKTFVYLLDYIDVNGKRHRQSLGHADARKAEAERKQVERKLRMGILAPPPMRLSDFLEDSLTRTGGQIRESTRVEYAHAMRDFIQEVGNIALDAVSFRHGEQFRQAQIDLGLRPATVAKKLREVKRLLELAVKRRQLDLNPLRHVESPKSPKRDIRVLTDDECRRLVGAAIEYTGHSRGGLRWDLLIAVALTTAMRRGEVLNAVWADIDFADKTITVGPKESTSETWAWQVKDTDRRTLPLTDEVVAMLVDHQAGQPTGLPYIFVPAARYEHIQRLRGDGQWSLLLTRQGLIANFTGRWRGLLKRANIDAGVKFHDLRRTCLSNWLADGMSEFDVMKLAGHSSFSTTHQFYLAVADDLVDRARASTERRTQILARSWHAPCFLAEGA